MPAEWAPHEATLIVMPHCDFTFRVDKAETAFLNLAHAIANEGDERVVLFCNDEAHAERVKTKIVNDKKRIEVAVCPTDDSWARDIGPTVVVANTNHADNNDNNNNNNNPTILGLDWDFNAWGGPEEGCYWPCEQDQVATAQMCKALNVEARKVPLILEGGSIHVDGEGTVLTTQECLLNQNRNPNKTKSEIETAVLTNLGATKMIWLPFGVDGDEDTNGHVDNWACFVKTGHIVLSWTDDNEHDPVNYQRCRQAFEILEKETDAKGRSLTIHKLQLPPPMFYTQDIVDSLALYKGTELPRKVGERMAGSYVNFYIANKAVIVPQYGCPQTDQKATETLSKLFPDRKVVGVQSIEVLIGGGNLHCITQQVPKV